VVRRAKLSVAAIKASELEGYRRIDAEHYQPRYLEMARRFEELKSLAETGTLIFHPAEVKRVYGEEGLQLLLAQNIRANRLDFSHVGFLTCEVEPEIRQNKLKAGDVVMTRSGANVGDAAFYDGSPAPIYASADCLVIRSQAIPGAYLSTFLNTDLGRALVRRGIYGAAQPHIAPDYLRSLRIPRDERTEQIVEQKLKQAKVKAEESEVLYARAQALLTAELGLDRLDLSEGLYSVRRASEALQAERIDAEHFRPKYYRVMDALEALKPKALVPLGSLASTLTNGHTPLHHSLDVGEILFLTAEHVFDFRINFDSDKRILVEHHETELARTQLREGDVLITIKGRVGNAAVVEHLFTPTNINQDVALLRLKPGYHPYYIAGFLNSAAGKALTEQVCTGQINPFLGLGNLSQVLIPIFEEARMTELGQELQQKVEQAYQARQGAKRLLAEARTEVERMIEEAQTCQVSKT